LVTASDADDRVTLEALTEYATAFVGGGPGDDVLVGRPEGRAVAGSNQVLDCATWSRTRSRTEHFGGQLKGTQTH
jgi:hypothetical protein